MSTAAAVFCECERRLSARCARCGGLACERCDLCHGCRRHVCACCDTVPTPAFTYPGDRTPHPHIEEDDE